MNFLYWFGFYIEYRLRCLLRGLAGFTRWLGRALGALLAAVMFFWICGRQFVEEQVNLARTRPLGPWFYPLGKYLFCGVTLAVLILGSVMGGIG